MNLTIIDTKNRLNQYELDTTQSRWVIGRGKTCDIIIDDVILSHIHGEIFLQNGRLFYRDLKSTNGTHIESQNSTKLLKNTDECIELTPFSSLRIGNSNFLNSTVLIFVENDSSDMQWKKKKIESNNLTIGRYDTNDIVLKHPSVSGNHCSICFHDGQYQLVHQKSTNGLFLNGRRFIGEKPLKDKDIITIIHFQIIYSNGYIFYKDDNDGLYLSIQHITKTVGSLKKRKNILTDVNCEINGNEFVAIVGGSGAGKTTLMNIMSGFDKKFSGNVFCNGIDLIDNFSVFKQIIGFVPQQDIIYENLTLQKMLEYTVQLKITNDLTKEEIQQQIKKVLTIVDLYSHRNTLIKKLSGGQKKRASIAVELLGEPRLFFLDEPTSGLDPGTERNIMYSLQTLAKQHHKTVIIVTHTTLNLHLCDKIIFMNPKGRLTFCGSAKEALDFFQVQDLTDIYNLIADKPDYWQQKYEQYTSQKQQTVRNQEKKIDDFVSSKKFIGFKQYKILTKRYGELMLKDIPRLLVLLFQPVLIALLLYIVADNDVFSIYDSTKSMLFSLDCAAIWIGLFNSIQEICKERVIVKREYMGSMKLSSYILSKITILTILGFIQSIILSQLFLVLVDAHKKGLFFSKFYIEIFITIWLTLLAATALGLFISALVKSGDKAMTIAPFALIVQLLFSGILFSLEDAGEIISYLTMSRWSVEALGSISRLNGMSLKIQKDFPAVQHVTESFFKATKQHVLFDWKILLLMIVFFLISSVLVLRRLPNEQR